MRTLVLAACASLAFAIAAHAQTPPAQQQPQPEATTPAAPSAQPTIRRVEVVDIKELPEAAQAEVNAAVAQGSETDIQGLRRSIDATPQITSVLREKGATSEHVIAASLGADGTLTLVTKKPG